MTTAAIESGLQFSTPTTRGHCCSSAAATNADYGSAIHRWNKHQLPGNMEDIVRSPQIYISCNTSDLYGSASPMNSANGQGSESVRDASGH
ncbi:hypothetical protein MHYP_G00209950 [Metynnis hypsauchen]